MQFIAFSIALFLLVQPVLPFLFGRSELIEPLSIISPDSIAIINATTGQAAILSSVFAHPDVLHLTLTSAFNMSSNDYLYITRPVIGAEEAILLDSNIYFSDAHVYALMKEPLGFAAISLQTSLVTSSVPLTGVDFVRTWRLGTHASGDAFPVVWAGLSFSWLLPNATFATLESAFSAAFIILESNQLYFLSVPQQAPVYATHVDLEDGTVRTGTPYPLAQNDSLSVAQQCCIQLNDSSIVFLAEVLGNIFVLHLDIATLTFTSSPLNASLTDIWTFTGLQCGPTAVPGQYLAWSKGPSGGSLEFFLLDLAAATFASYDMYPVLDDWHTVAVSPGGDVVASVCVTETPTDCVLRWEIAFNASDPSHAYSWLTTPPVVSFGVSVQSADIAVIRMQNILYNGPGSGFLVLALAPVPHVIALVCMQLVFGASDHFSIDPVTQAIYFTDDILLSANNMYSIDWRNPTPVTIAQKYPLPSGMDSFRALDVQLVVQASLLFISACPLTSNCTFYQVSVAPYSLIDSVSSGSGVCNQLFAGPNNTLLFTDSLGLREWNLTSFMLVRTWPYAHDPAAFTWVTVASVLVNGTFYSVQWDSESTLSCFSIQLAAPNATLPPLAIAALPNASFTGWVSAQAVVVDGFLFVGLWFEDSAQILKYSLECSLLSVFDTRVPNTGDYKPVISVADMLYFGRSPDVIPVYVDCGQGAYRNLSSGQCDACPDGSVNAQADTQACTPCPARTDADPTHTLCLCSAGFHSAANNADCDTCPEGGDCLDGNLLQPAPGYWRNNSTSLEFYACPFGLAACNGSDVCTTAYRGTLCAVCAHRYALVAGLCRHCSSFLASVGFWLLAALLYLVVFLGLLIPGGLEAVSVLKSFISFAQIVTFPTRGPMPHLLATKFAVLGRFLSLANFQILSIVSPDCLFGRHLNFPTTAVAQALLPIFFLLLIFILMLVPWHRAFDKCCRSASSASARPYSSDPFNEGTPGLADRFEAYKRSGTPLRVMLFIVLLATPSCTQQLASFFTCQEVAEIVYLVRDYTVQCYHGLWNVFAAPVSLLLCLYALGVPAALFTLLYRYRDTLDLRFLHGSYRDEHYWWDVTEQVRKLALLLCNAVLAPRAPSYYGPTALAISVVAICAHMQVQPYSTRKGMWFQTANLSGVILYYLWSVSDDSAEDTTAWVYWIFAVCYTLVSAGVMLWPLLAKLGACTRRYFGRGDPSGAAENELDPLMPSKK